MPRAQTPPVTKFTGWMSALRFLVGFKAWWFNWSSQHVKIIAEKTQLVRGGSSPPCPTITQGQRILSLLLPQPVLRVMKDVDGKGELLQSAWTTVDGYQSKYAIIAPIASCDVIVGVTNRSLPLRTYLSRSLSLERVATSYNTCRERGERERSCIVSS